MPTYLFSILGNILPVSPVFLLSSSYSHTSAHPPADKYSLSTGFKNTGRLRLSPLDRPMS